jgi:hypothetical protein
MAKSGMVSVQESSLKVAYFKALAKWKDACATMANWIEGSPEYTKASIELAKSDAIMQLISSLVGSEKIAGWTVIVCGFTSGDSVKFESDDGKVIDGVVIGKSYKGTACVEIAQGGYIWNVHNCLIKSV